MGLFGNLFTSKNNKQVEEIVENTKQSFWSKITKVLTGKSTINQEELDRIEETLIHADIGVETTIAILDSFEKNVQKQKYSNQNELLQILKTSIIQLFNQVDSQNTDNNINAHSKPHVILVVGVNGVGKTTTIGKLANLYKKQGLSVLVGAADTFRAAAADQLAIWCERVKVPLITQSKGADPSAVAFDTVQSAIAKNIDVVIIDTAGRLHNKPHLMDELNKIKRVIQKKISTAPHEVLLVLDGSTGQNAIEQAKQFSSVTNVTDIVITKLDGTAKGGVVLGIVYQLKIPIKYIGVGEKVDDLLLFDKKNFVESLVNFG